MTVQGRSPSAAGTSNVSPISTAATGIDERALVEGFPGPAALFDGRGRLQLANSHAAALTDNHEVFLGELGAVISAAARSGQAVNHRLRTVEGDEDKVLDLAIVPVGDDHLPERGVLVLGRDSTFDVNLATALIASRRLFQDLVACSVDFAWETKPDGRFSFVSARGALGYSATELDGALARELLLDTDDDGVPVFESRDPVDDIEIWLRPAVGEPACMRVSATPVFDQDGRWVATRGVCRDITEAKMSEAALAQARERETLIASVVDTIRRVIAPEDVYSGAVEQIAATATADYAAILRQDADSRWQFAAEVKTGAVALLDDGFIAADGGVGGHSLSVFTADGCEQIAAPCCYHDELKGWLCVVRPQSAKSEDHVQALLATVADHLGIAMAQADVQAKLERLSRIDELTGLLNRRAFRETAQRRMAHHRRTGRTGALLFVDMDNFKAVNDVRGHQAGDDALRLLAAILGGGDNRQSDIVARLGGDEFALWLEETDGAGAQQRAERLLQRCGALKKFSGTPDKPLSISIGVVVSQPERSDSLDRLIELADGAMYEAKRGGKGRIAVVDLEQE